MPNAGNGLFTAIDIYKDEIIAVYTGVIIDQGEAKNRAGAGLDRYFINLPDGSVMDSMPMEGFAKYANDASAFGSTAFRNNAQIILDQSGNPAISAKRKIKKGSEIFCGYGRRYWKKHLPKKV